MSEPVSEAYLRAALAAERLSTVITFVAVVVVGLVAFAIGVHFGWTSKRSGGPRA